MPLPDMAIKVLDQAKEKIIPHSDGLVFPSLITGRSLSDMTLTKALRIAGVEKGTVHGMRSAFRDWAAEKTAIAGEVVEAALAHTIRNKVEAAYRRTNYLEKRRLLMDTWANYLAFNTSNIVQIAI